MSTILAAGGVCSFILSEGTGLSIGELGEVELGGCGVESSE